MYSFHTSANLYAEFWNNSFSFDNVQLSRKQIWQTIIQESIRALAKDSGILFEIDANTAIDQVTEQAFKDLGEDGLIQIARNHSCSDCTKLYKKTVDDEGDPDILVNMAVMDGIVMGPTVSSSY